MTDEKSSKSGKSEKSEKSEKKPQAKLTGAQLRKLRALGHSLDAVIAVGKDGVTDALVRATETALDTHELVKVKTHREAPTDRHEAAIALAARTGSVLAQVIGRTFLLYKRRPDDADKKKERGRKPKSQIDLSMPKKKPALRPAKKPAARVPDEAGEAVEADEDDRDEGDLGDN